MSLRVLVIDCEKDFRRLLAQHVSAAHEDATVVEYDPAVRGPLPPDYSASGYDLVLLGASEGSGQGELRDLAGRPGFPPIILLAGDTSAAAVDAALEAGARACLSRARVDHAALAAALRDARSRRSSRHQDAPARMPASRTARFGNITLRGYHYLRQLAESPMSSVYLAFSERDDCELVLKVLHQAPDDGHGGRVFDRFLREYDIAATIVHPNVVRIFDFGASDDCAYIAMEYFPKGDLRTRIKRGIQPLRALSMLRQMAAALQVLHGAGILHRDLKPGNVMLRDDETVAVIDYGMAKHLALEANITGSGEIFGTPYYMSPEQGHGRETDERSDIYSLGIIFYEMLLRQKPYTAATPMQVIYLHAHAPLPELPPQYRDFAPILAGCIAKEARDRFASAADLVAAAQALEEVVSQDSLRRR